jgi:hypothetical protein
VNQQIKINMGLRNARVDAILGGFTGGAEFDEHWHKSPAFYPNRGLT